MRRWLRCCCVAVLDSSLCPILKLRCVAVKSPGVKQADTDPGQPHCLPLSLSLALSLSTIHPPHSPSLPLPHPHFCPSLISFYTSIFLSLAPFSLSPPTSLSLPLPISPFVPRSFSLSLSLFSPSPALSLSLSLLIGSLCVYLKAVFSAASYTVQKSGTTHHLFNFQSKQTQFIHLLSVWKSAGTFFHTSRIQP